MTVIRRSLPVLLVLAGAAVSSTAHATDHAEKAARIARLGSSGARREEAALRQIESTRVLEAQARQRSADELVRHSRLGKGTEYSRRLESPFARNNRTERAWSSRNPWMAATHPSIAPRVTKSLWQRTGVAHMTIAGQMTSVHSPYLVSSVHQMLMRRPVEPGPSLSFINAYARHGAALHGSQMHGAQMHGGSPTRSSTPGEHGSMSLFAALR